ncbi:MAG: prolyl oligopeptidase family serine peptidase [Pedobacter sp.]|uniref:S9 family peptidase n=1 Tax=Pedobacter sp. TaxID=1411316 RepID=UPI003399C24C
MIKNFVLVACCCVLFKPILFNTANAQTVSMEAVTSFPFVSGITAAATGAKIAFTVNEKGKRNIYTATGPDFTLRKLTAYTADDGQEITSVTISPDGNWIAFVRGGDHGAFDESIPRNASSAPDAPKIQVYCIPFEGGTPTLISEGDHPVISPQSDQLAFIKDGQVWRATYGRRPAAKKMFHVRGSAEGIKWSPDGRQMLFTVSRADHSLIGIYRDSLTSIQWMAPAFSRDQSPQWSPDGKQVAFIRRPARGGAPDSLTVDILQPWSIWTAEAASGKGKEIWKAAESLRASLPATNGGTNLHWAARDRITFVSCQDGWPHLYSVPPTGGTALLLTPGNFIAEHIQLSADSTSLLFSTNLQDPDRRHLARVPVDKAAMELLTSGTGLESNPVMLGNGEAVAALFATAQQPNLPGIVTLRAKKQIKLIGKELIPADFPLGRLVSPRSVSFKAADGNTVYGQIFEPRGGPSQKPAILFVHGGPQRQMLLGWHYGDYYSNTYALNQYLAGRGFIVLAVNYRLGIGYGFDFQNPRHSWTAGASEYQDIRAAGHYLAGLKQVDSARIGIYGGSYGGYLTAMALAQDSKLFAAGVDIHGEHNLMVFAPGEQAEPAPDLALAKELMWKSSPVAWLSKWTSPVLIVHGDDDGNVKFHQSVDLINRLAKKNVSFETLMVPDETHHWMKYEHMLQVDQATAEFLTRKLLLK